MLARIVRTMSYRASQLDSSATRIESVRCDPPDGSPAAASTATPNSPSSFAMFLTSDRSGAPCSVTGSSVNNPAAISGSVAFFDPLTRTAPFSRRPPSMTNASMPHAPGRSPVCLGPAPVRRGDRPHAGHPAHSRSRLVNAPTRPAAGQSVILTVLFCFALSMAAKMTLTER